MTMQQINGASGGALSLEPSPTPDTSDQWTDALNEFQTINDQAHVAMLGVVGGAKTSDGFAQDAAALAPIDDRAQALDARVQSLPTMAGIDQDSQLEMRMGIDNWSSAIHHLHTGYAQLDPQEVEAGISAILLADQEMSDGAARLRAQATAIAGG